MKYIMFILCLIPLFVNAEDSSRVVFFRVDRMGESGDIYHDDSLIASSPLHLFYIYNTDAPGGRYFWGIKNAINKDHSDWGAMTSISAGKNSVTFVIMKFVVDGKSSYNYMNTVSFADFKKYYERNKGLKKRLHAALRARVASATSDLVAQATSKPGGNINVLQTLSAFFIGHPVYSTLPGSFATISYNSLMDPKTPIFSLSGQTIKNIAVGSLGNMLGNRMSGSIRGGMMQTGTQTNLFTEFVGQQYGHQQMTAIDEATNKKQD